ncbi:hypothetical protein AAFC00_006376 [Neodothiora populina]|uniref:Serine aminopeptidase S33 domain-containing protein n=1 Tax=Neodothiora populina TaxID=2781224 RepID=A0ABR3P6B8_9PEZI
MTRLQEASGYLPVLGAASCALLAYTIYSRSGTHTRDVIIRSPLTDVLRLPSRDRDRLPYPPDGLPGGRTVDSPYGSVRVHEWGPENGRKVLLIHGISTPAVALASVAEELVENGCRVMLFDIFGRGYSCTPNPITEPHDMKLFTSQILIVLASSPLAWTGEEGFSLIGYSLGGGIAATFTSYFPTLVDSLILVAPAGLIRQNRISWTSKLLYEGVLPHSLVSWLVWRRLGGHEKKTRETKTIEPIDLVDEETTTSHPALSPDSQAPLRPRRPSVSVADAVGWQLHNHKGFLPAFISSIQHAPISNQHEHWRRIGSRLRAQRIQTALNPQDSSRQGLREGKVLMILGRADDIILADQVSEDARGALGEENVDIKVLEGGHDIPIVRAQAVAKSITDFWSECE